MDKQRECERQAERFNRDCQCVTFDKAAMREELLRQPGGDDLYRLIFEERPTLFADSPIFVPEACVRRQAAIVEAIERTVALPAYRARVLRYAPPAAQYVPKARGVFFGYDFHLDAAGPRLIEINTNAGGMLLNASLLRAQIKCCDWALGNRSPACTDEMPERMLEDAFLAMFLEEWRLERGDMPLRSVAIVDEAPEGQFLYPEFLLFQQLFERNGIEAAICDPGELAWRDGGLWHGERRIDLVYDRLTDFGLQGETCRALREAYLAGAVAVTPHPHAHAVYADKRNLALLTDPEVLLGLGVDAQTRETLLSGIARTEIVRREDAERFWAERKRLFFKPAAGYGSKAAYRGDKLTRRVFGEILGGDYVAQALAPPSERRLRLGDEDSEFKFDLRNYVYGGRVQLIATRLYRGQTTNFRTPGGGFAPVVVLPCIERP